MPSSGSVSDPVLRYDVMLLSFRRAAIPEIEAAVATKALVHTGYRVHVIRNYGVICDDDLFLPSMARIGRTSRAVLTVVLAGRARIRVDGSAGGASHTPVGFERWLEAGDVVLLPVKAVVAMRQEGAPFRSIAIEWDAGTLASGVSAEPQGVTLDAIAFARMLRLADALESSADTASASVVLADILSVLRAQGAPFDPVQARDLVEPVAEPVVRLARALDAVLSRLAHAPALVDLDSALGLSLRQINRVVTQFNRRYGFNSLGWRDTRNRRRILVGATMMTARGARTELVARAMGYSSPTGFCHALDLAGLPAPGATADIVERLR
jgi:hypothetical protein